VTTESHAIVHPDSRLWTGDLARWEQEVAVWQRELTAATDELDRTAEAAEERRRALEGDSLTGGGALLAQHRAVLVDHRTALEGHRDRLRGELAFVAEYAAAAGTPGEQPEPVRPSDALAERVARHPRLWEAHERLSRHHHAVMEATARLLRASAQPAGG
jgi:hypothetical protein